MVAEPADTPVTLPDASTVATEVFELLQVPPVTASVMATETPAHNVVDAALIAPAVAPGVTVRVAVVLVEPQLLLTV